MMISAIVLPTVFLPVAGAEATGSTKDKGLRYQSILVQIPGVKFPEAKSLISPNQMYYVGEASCTNDDVGAGVLDDLNRALKTFYVEFGDPAKPDDVVGRIWKAVFGDSTYTDKVRRGLCEVVADDKKYADYIATAEKIVSSYGTTVRIRPEYVGNSEEAKDNRLDFWAEKLGRFGTALKPWLPIDLKSA
ncbi:hypothetical protein [Nocardia sp. CS682]|uniref:hypothetical protein n=1 Tax=Nocardia sp. CS682 TaxID=1047172 RepID=UPI001074D3A2|nr:hypothetical protein [Nocardia sp. CS682]QBS44057.1 hypothetical protein DMB37_32145 [Nocardia sp. CS682]